MFSKVVCVGAELQLLKRLYTDSDSAHWCFGEIWIQSMTEWWEMEVCDSQKFVMQKKKEEINQINQLTVEAPDVQKPAGLWSSFPKRSIWQTESVKTKQTHASLFFQSTEVKSIPAWTERERELNWLHFISNKEPRAEGPFQKFRFRTVTESEVRVSSCRV